MTWQDARDYAQSRGGDLASIPLGQWNVVAGAFDPGSGYPESCWIGAIQDPAGDEPDQGWDWVDEQLLFQPSWLSGEPDDGSGGACPPTNCQNHDVAVMSFPAAGTNGMADDDATVLHLGLIQRPTTAACDPQADTARNFARTFAWQFRYDSPRGRYMRRMLDPDTLAEVLTDWTVYEGNAAVSDFIEDGTMADTQRHYVGAKAHAEVDTNGDWDSEAWFFRNQIGTTELARAATGFESLHLAYTAFGEEYDLTTGVGVDTRYRYAGEWGYQSHDDFPFQHVGARWYDPETGRFLQRDPIGIGGGLNVYAYVRNNPLAGVDPDGLQVGPPKSCPDCDLQPPALGLPPTILDKIKDKIKDKVKEKLVAFINVCLDLKDITNSVKEIINVLKNKLPVRVPGPIPPFFVIPPGLESYTPGKRVIATRYFDADNKYELLCAVRSPQDLERSWIQSYDCHRMHSTFIGGMYAKY